MRKEEVKLPLFADNMFSYLETPKKYTYTQVLELINEFSKVARHKINIQKAITFLEKNAKLETKEQYYLLKTFFETMYGDGC